jgi:hypothetical protein
MFLISLLLARNLTANRCTLRRIALRWRTDNLVKSRLIANTLKYQGKIAVAKA